MTTKLDLLSLLPSDTPEYMAPAWLGCIHFALGEKDIMCAFRHDTGNLWEPGKSAMDRMVDEACGAQENFMREFVLWCNVNVWGQIDGGIDESQT